MDTKHIDRRENKEAHIYIDGYLYLAKRIDSTHLSLNLIGNSNINITCPHEIIYHVGQLSERSYYQDIVNWLHDKKEIDGNDYC